MDILAVMHHRRVDSDIEAEASISVSRDLFTLLSENGGQTLFGKDVFAFRCGMAKVGYERWLWWSPEVHNPYMGQKMLDCGNRLDVLEP